LKNVYDLFQERGFTEQVTDENMLRELLAKPISCYIGFDPTAKSLHVGSLLPIMSLAHMQREGHRPIVVVGGGTSLVGDPSGKDEIRPVMTREEIDSNAEAIKKQMSRFIDFSNGKALMLNNADWLAPLNYIDFLRDIGRHFSVNRMLAAESYRQRLEIGLSFLEFNYMLLQAYDFWYLFKHYNCLLQMGGNDQWAVSYTHLRAHETLRYLVCRLLRQDAIEDIEAIPTYSMTSDDLGNGIEAYVLFNNTHLCATRSEARRLISQGGGYVNGKRIPSFETKVGPDDVQSNTILLRAGKKKYLRVCIQDS